MINSVLLWLGNIPIMVFMRILSFQLWFKSITPAFSVTCIGDIFVHLSTCHLSTGYVTWPTSKCWHNGLFYGQTRLLVKKMDLFDIKLRFGVSRSHSVKDKLTVLNVYIFRSERPNSTGSHNWDLIDTRKFEIIL